jgi:hypothetical protein
MILAFDGREDGEKKGRDGGLGQGKVVWAVCLGWWWLGQERGLSHGRRCLVVMH